MTSISPRHFFVYVLINSLTDSVFYVGKGANQRMSYHEREARNGSQSYKCRVIRKIWQDGGYIIRKKVAEFPNAQDAYIYEWCLITMIYGRENLTNGTDGGEGMLGAFTPEQLEQKAQRIRGMMQDPVIAAKIKEGRIRSHSDPQYRKEQSHRSKQQWNGPDKKGLAKLITTPEFQECRLRGARKTKNAKTFDGLVSPDGIVYAPIHNLTAFCKEHGLCLSSMHYLAIGDFCQCKGWTRYPPLTQERKKSGPAYFAHFQAPDGTIHEVENLRDFCLKQGLSESSLRRVHTGRQYAHKGWTRYIP